MLSQWAIHQHILAIGGLIIANPATGFFRQDSANLSRSEYYSYAHS